MSAAESSLALCSTIAMRESESTLLVPTPEYAVPDVLRALAAFRPRFPEVLLKHLDEPDVIVVAPRRTSRRSGAI